MSRSLSAKGLLDQTLNELKSSVSCPSCHEVVSSPTMILNCGHIVCHDHIPETSGHKKCPICAVGYMETCPVHLVQGVSQTVQSALDAKTLLQPETRGNPADHAIPTLPQSDEMNEMKSLLGNKEFEINALKKLVEKLVLREKVANLEIEARDEKIKALIEENVRTKHMIRQHQEDFQMCINPKIDILDEHFDIIKSNGNLIFDGDKLQVTHAGGRYGNAAVVCDKAYPTHGITTTKFKIINSHDNRGRGMQFGIVTRGFDNLNHWIGQDIHSWSFGRMYGNRAHNNKVSGYY